MSCDRLICGTWDWVAFGAGLIMVKSSIFYIISMAEKVVKAKKATKKITTKTTTSSSKSPRG